MSDRCRNNEAVASLSAQERVIDNILTSSGVTREAIGSEDSKGCGIFLEIT